MSIRRYLVLVLCVLAGFGVGFFMRSPAPRHAPSEVAEIKSIEVSRPAAPDAYPPRIETRLRIDRVIDSRGNVVRESRGIEDNAKPAWKLTIDGTILYATPE